MSISMTCPLQVGDWTHIEGYGFALHHKLGLVVSSSILPLGAADALLK